MIVPRSEKAREGEVDSVDRRFYLRQIADLRNELEVVQTQLTEIKSLYEARERQCQDVERECRDDLDKLRAESREILSELGAHFHTFFPSYRSLAEFLITKPRRSPDPADQRNSKVRRSKADGRAFSRDPSEFTSKLERLKRENPPPIRHLNPSVPSERVPPLKSAIEELRGELADSHTLIREDPFPVGFDSLDVLREDPLVADLDSIDVPPELKRTLCSIVQNRSVSTSSRFVESLKAVAAFYTQPASESMVPTEIMEFLENLGGNLLDRDVPLSDIIADSSIRAEMLDSAKSVKDSESVSLQEFEELKADLERAEAESHSVCQKMREIRDSLHFGHFLKDIISRMTRKVAALEKNVSRKEGRERVDMQKKIADLHRQMVLAQRELDILNAQEFADCVDESSTYEVPPEWGDPSYEELGDRVIQLEEEKEDLRRQIEDERNAYVFKMRDSRLGAIDEYENVVNQLKRRCEEQKSIIDALMQDSNKRKSSGGSSPK
jgi:hypothetical protein